MIRLENISKSFEHHSNKIKVLNSIDLTIDQGSWVSIVGPSGSGKSTLLKIISGLLKPDTGTVNYRNVNIYQLSEREKSDFRRRHIGFVFQDFKLLPYYSVLDNVILPLYYDEKKKDLYEKAKVLLPSLGIQEPLFSRLPNDLSGGEKQRVAFARALIANPDVLVCDEPTGNLDRENRDNVIEILLQLTKQGKTIILVTHDMEVAVHSDNIYLLKDGFLLSNEVKV
ncbi:ABC transporter ATP-binding protein [Anoxybacteroides tepidamans]|uniref:ABC transporter ATP-binding protein n=1 Tax=Anoxybacteroides tepidamans TaxID=265948 RepID=UPI00048915B7|nr:ABC transporter ATP-binding protein [Anoxybacillus tepidamans]